MECDGVLVCMNSGSIVTIILIVIFILVLIETINKK